MNANKIMIVLGILIICLPKIYALAGVICNSSSPCSCNGNCDGYYEFQGYNESYCLSNPINCFNTIDNCQDGNYCALNYVVNITVNSLNDSVFRARDTIEVDVTVYSASANYEAVFILYTNDSNNIEWNYIYDTGFSVGETRHIKVNLTLDNIIGNHSIRAIDIYDEHSNITCGWDGFWRQYADTDDITFNVEKGNDAPVIENLSFPLDSSTLTYTTIDFNFSASDDLSRINCSLYGNFTGTWQENKIVYNVSNNTITNITLALNDGIYGWNIFCYDYRNFSGNFQNNFTLTVDTKAPNISIEGPINNSIKYSNLVNFQFNVSDLSPLLNCILVINGLVNKTNDTVIYRYSSGQNISQHLKNGNYNWSINCTDSNGFQGMTLTYNLSIVNTEPVLVSVYINQSNYTPIENSTIYILVQFNVTDNEDLNDLNDSSCLCAVDNQSNFVSAFTSNQSCSATTIGSNREYSCKIPMLFWYNPGNWSLKIALKDNSNNTISNQSLSFIYNELTAYSVSGLNVNFGTINSSYYYQNKSSGPTTIINTGNKEVYLNITGDDIDGEDDIAYSNYFYVNTINNTVSATKIGTQSNHINNGTIPLGGYHVLYWFFNVPFNLEPGNYSGNWTLSVY